MTRCPAPAPVLAGHSAVRASPCFDIGYPSKVVMMEDGVPGMRKRVAEIRPPDTDPTYIATSRTSASVLSI